jgi:hypothetical protein
MLDPDELPSSDNLDGRADLEEELGFDIETDQRESEQTRS